MEACVGVSGFKGSVAAPNGKIRSMLAARDAPSLPLSAGKDVGMAESYAEQHLAVKDNTCDSTETAAGISF